MHPLFELGDAEQLKKISHLLNVHGLHTVDSMNLLNRLRYAATEAESDMMEEF